MATLDNERYLRHMLLLGKGGLLVLRGIVTREASRRGQTLEHILETNRAVFKNLVKEQYMRLFPSTSTVNANVQSWDMSLLMVVVKRLFMGTSGLSPADTSSIKTLKEYRNYIQGHPNSMGMSATDYDKNQRLLKPALLQLASGISADTDTKIKDIISRTESGYIDILSSLEHIKELHEFKTSFLVTLESKLTDVNHSLNYIETRGAKTSHVVEKILKMQIHDFKRKTKNELQTIIEAKCDQRQKEKEALCLLFEFVEIIQNQNDFSKEEIKHMIEQRIRYYGDLCLQLVDDLLSWFTDMRNIPDAVPGIAQLGCIRIPMKCSSMKGMLKHLEYMDSDECEQRLSKISCSLSNMLRFSCSLSWTIEPDSLQNVMKTLSEELETPDPTSKTVKIVLPFQSKSLEGLTNIWTIFEGEEANSHLTKVSETLSKIVGANVSLTASVVMDQFTKAVYERSKGYLTEATMAAGGPHFTPEQGVFDEETLERVKKVQIPVDNIGGGAGADLSADDWEKIKKVRKLRELWHGRFTNRNLTTLLKHHDWDENATNLFILDALPGELRDVLGEDDWQVVENVRRNNVLRDLARLSRIGHEVRQYGCKQDDNMWWRRVPSRKPVSKCKRCKQKYEPIPREQEWGWAMFECVCGHKFNAFAMMDRSLLGPRYTGKRQSLCYRCMSQICEPIHILPPIKPKNNEREPGDGQYQRRRPRRYTHRCTAPNCFNRYMPDPRSNEPLITICVHPNSLKDKVHGFGSDRHVSKGSTVNTFLSQDDIDSYYEPSLADIDEIDIDDGGNL